MKLGIVHIRLVIIYVALQRLKGHVLGFKEKGRVVSTIWECMLDLCN